MILLMKYYHLGFKKRFTASKKESNRKSDIIVCISQNTAKDLFKFNPVINPNKVRVIYNGVSKDYFPLTNKDDYGDYVLFVGMRGRYKNFKFTVNSLVNTKYKLLICGTKLNEYEVKYLEDKLGKIDIYT